MGEGGTVHVSPHAFRHTYSTLLVEAGVPIAHVAEVLGDTIAVVESTYAHVLRPKHEVTSILSGPLSGWPEAANYEVRLASRPL